MNDKYKTDDTFQAAVLMSLGLDIDIDSSESRVQFNFDRTPEFDQAISDYVNKKVLIEPFTLKANMDYLYKTIYSLRK